MQRLIEKAENEHSLCEEELAWLLTSSAAEEPLAAAADRVRRKYVGDGVHLRGLIEFTNICRQNCLYCGLRRENERAERYRLHPQEIVRLSRAARDYGYRTVVLQGGEDGYWHVDRLAPILREIRALGLVITLSIGERTKEEYRALKEAGASRFLLRIETTDCELYERLDPGMSWEARCACLASLRALGYEVGTGSLVGLPGQSVESLARDILFFQEIDADMAGIGPFIPNGDTPLGEAAAGDIHRTRRMVSLLRLLLPEANI
ncbi:MAG: [FeFe] hydrogenase H-cluster radical SAM maturase HydE, partial [Selenomonas sp.]